MNAKNSRFWSLENAGPPMFFLVVMLFCALFIVSFALGMVAFALSGPPPQNLLDHDETAETALDALLRQAEDKTELPPGYTMKTSSLGRWKYVNPKGNSWVHSPTRKQAIKWAWRDYLRNKANEVWTDEGLGGLEAGNGRSGM